MMAMRMARAYTGRSKVIKFFDHFHGWSDYANAGGLTGMDGIPDNVLETMIVLQPGDIGAVETAIQNNDVAAIIIESTGAHMGSTPIHPDFLQGIRDLATKHGVVFILDEVVTGFRVHKGGAQGLYEVMPDLSSLAKILAGGQTLIPTMKQRLASPSTLIDISGIDELNFIHDSENSVTIGSTITHHEVSSSDIIISGRPA